MSRVGWSKGKPFAYVPDHLCRSRSFVIYFDSVDEYNEFIWNTKALIKIEFSRAEAYMAVEYAKFCRHTHMDKVKALIKHEPGINKFAAAQIAVQGGGGTW